ncbi:hypothetical protein JZO77_02125 [Enterococcus hulanensis]|uniref:hypothetical protein n=1 Tax=Enterococcus hulanensis TaxID=2559929 RepID=UPI001A8D4847|nr:hypothetical protein [Enterococcus hulanensis]MBO0455541.1 hypothetical protein [Enterococcus hulanensis]
MINNKKILEFYKEQSKFGFIESVKIYKDIKDEHYVNYLEISFFNYPYVEGDKKMLITFQNISDLNLGNLDGLLKTVFSITDISSYQMENVKYKVVDDENNLVCFNCKDFEFSFS